MPFHHHLLVVLDLLSSQDKRVLNLSPEVILEPLKGVKYPELIVVRSMLHLLLSWHQGIIPDATLVATVVSDYRKHSKQLNDNEHRQYKKHEEELYH